MLDEKTRMAIALKRFSLISPILNGQVKSIGGYCAEITAEPIEMPHYGLKRYSPNTVSCWYSEYVRYGLEGLKPKPRSDRGRTRALTADMAEKILAKAAEFPKSPATVIYDMLTQERAFLKSEVSLATVRRFIQANGAAAAGEAGLPKQMLRFAKERVNDLWQTDVMYGPYLKCGRKKQATYLLAYIDDASRLITHAQFYLSQDIQSLRNSFKEAVLRRGIPKLLYTDNGQIYRCQSFEYLCANIGVALLHHGVGMAHMKGKVERFFKTVRSRFLSRLKEQEIHSLESLNGAFWQWLDTDYQKKPHEGLKGQAPLEFFLNQSENINLPANLADFNTKFLVKAVRTIRKDATLSLNGQIYETDPALCGTRLDVKYDPDEQAGAFPEVLLFKEDSLAGVARLVSFHDNACRKRTGRGAAGQPDPAAALPGRPQPQAAYPEGIHGMGTAKSHTISYADLREGDA